MSVEGIAATGMGAAALATFVGLGGGISMLRLPPSNSMRSHGWELVAVPAALAVAGGLTTKFSPGYRLLGTGVLAGVVAGALLCGVVSGQGKTFSGLVDAVGGVKNFVNNPVGHG